MQKFQFQPRVCFRVLDEREDREQVHFVFARIVRRSKKVMAASCTAFDFEPLRAARNSVIRISQTGNKFADFQVVSHANTTSRLRAGSERIVLTLAAITEQASGVPLRPPAIA